MTRPALLSWPVYNEVRALLPAWVACVLSVIVPAVVYPRLMGLSLIAYILGAVALGALSLGQEYTDRTLSLLLSQPVGGLSLQRSGLSTHRR